MHESADGLHRRKPGQGPSSAQCLRASQPRFGPAEGRFLPDGQPVERAPVRCGVHERIGYGSAVFLKNEELVAGNGEPQRSPRRSAEIREKGFGVVALAPTRPMPLTPMPSTRSALTPAASPIAAPPFHGRMPPSGRTRPHLPPVRPRPTRHASNGFGAGPCLSLVRDPSSFRQLCASRTLRRGRKSVKNN